MTLNAFCARAMAIMGLTLLPASGPANELILVKDGKPACVIVVPGSASAVTMDAAAELQDGLRKISGADVPVKGETALTPSERAETLVVLGEGDLARECGVEAKSLKPEGFHIKTVGNRLVLLGREDIYAGQSRQRGTYFAAIALLEDQLRMRWLWPGTLGQVVPKKQTITIPSLDITDAPALQIRIIRDSLLIQKTTSSALARQQMKLEPERVKQMAKESRQWLSHQRLGQSIQMNYSHAFRDWWKKYQDKHLDYFAQQLDGKRGFYKELGGGGADRIKICVSNPAVLDQFMQNAQVFFKARPEVATFSASPNDSAYDGHCMCEGCKAWDAMNAPTTVTLVSVNDAGKRVKFEYPALTDRYVHFYNLAADRLEKVAPGKMIGGYAYDTWRTPPVRERVRDNVVIGYVGFNRLASTSSWEHDLAEWDAWAEATQRLFLRPNLLHFGHGYPLYYPGRLARTIRHCAETGMIGADFDSLMHHWANQGVNYYILSKLLWNPKADVNKLVDDYCASGFAKAAPAVREYFDVMGQYTERVGAIPTSERNPDNAKDILPLHTPELFGSFQAPLDKAKSLAADDPVILDRIAFLEKGLQYMRLHSEALRLVSQNAGKTLSKPAQDAVAARQAFYEENKYSFAVGVPDIVYWDSKNFALYHGFSRKAEKAKGIMKDGAVVGE